VDSDRSVYNFLSRHDALHTIENYNSFEIPKTRREIAEYLNQINEKSESLSPIDKQILADFLSEFEFDRTGILTKAISPFAVIEYSPLSEKEKYLFYFVDKDRANLFINLTTQVGMIFNNKIHPQTSNSTTYAGYGGIIRGTFLDKFGFMVKGENSKVFGNKATALLKKEIRYNFKFNENEKETFFDEASGYITADFRTVIFKLGRDRLKIGYGAIKSLFDDNAPLFDYLGFDIKYDFFSFSYFHGKLLGEQKYFADLVTGGYYTISDKFVGYHRIGFEFSKNVSFGMGEIIVYGNRPMDLSYVNPFNFYKTIEHSNRDRDNAMLFLDVKNNSIKGLKIYANLLIDDISFDKLGSGWYGNQTMINAGIYSSGLFNYIPIEVLFEYFRIEPYTFTHRLQYNNFTNMGYNFSSFLQPNSELFVCGFNYYLNYRLILNMNFGYSVHGANPVINGNVRNVGGDINLGHRTNDPESVKFLGGDLEYSRFISALITFEPVNQYFILLKAEYTNTALQNSVKKKELNTFITFQLTF
jgi:hypothetical protein